MAKYEKWLGASLGWIITGNPIGGLIGFFAGAMADGNEKKSSTTETGISEFEINLMVLASYLIKIDGKVSLEEITFVNNFLNTHFDEKFSVKREQILHHCLNKEYDLNVACDKIRLYTGPETRVQVVRFLFDLAKSDGELSERENYFIFRIAGYLNINDVEFRRIKKEEPEQFFSVYETLGVKKEMSFGEIRTVYRKLVLKYHPDRNKDVSEEEKRKLARKFQQVQEAYEKIKAERGEK
ncbi:MAG: DnaJ-like protein [Bacteroidota bacterium]|nr:DnaJ-like protein [Bacteroidota bacterium]